MEIGERKKKILIESKGIENINRREDEIVGKIEVEKDLRVKSEFELLKDKLVNEDEGIDKGS